MPQNAEYRLEIHKLKAQVSSGWDCEVVTLLFQTDKYTWISQQLISLTPTGNATFSLSKVPKGQFQAKLKKKKSTFLGKRNNTT